MSRLLTTAVTAVALFAPLLVSAAPAWACMPMPPNASATMEASGTVLVGRVTIVDQSPAEPCIAEARARASQQYPGDPGEAGCTNFGFAAVEPVRFIKGEAEEGADPFRVAYNSREFCAVGWTAEVGQLVVITVPHDRSTLREGTTASLEGVLQHEQLFRTILDLVEETQPSS